MLQPKTGDMQQDRRAGRGERLSLRLYIADHAPNSAQAVSNLQAICDEHLVDGFELEIVDVLQDPRRALDDQVLVTPTLVRLWPLPVVKIVGDLSEREQVLSALRAEQV